MVAVCQGEQTIREPRISIQASLDMVEETGEALTEESWRKAELADTIAVLLVLAALSCASSGASAFGNSSIRHWHRIQTRPTGSAPFGCRGFTGPVPPPLFMSAWRQYGCRGETCQGDPSLAEAPPDRGSAAVRALARPAAPSLHPRGVHSRTVELLRRRRHLEGALGGFPGTGVEPAIGSDAGRAPSLRAALRRSTAQEPFEGGVGRL